MRLKPQKIQHLSRAIYKSLAANPEVELDGDEAKVCTLIANLITADLKEEEEIEELAREMLTQYAAEIDRTGASYDKLLQRAKQKIATERRFVL